VVNVALIDIQGGVTKLHLRFQLSSAGDVLYDLWPSFAFESVVLLPTLSTGQSVNLEFGE